MSRRSCVRALLALALAAAPLAAAQVELRAGAEASAWALDPRTGRVFAGLADAVVALSAESGEVGERWQVTAGARRLLVKGRWLLVGHASDASVTVIDLDVPGADPRRIELQGWEPVSLFASEVPNDLAYAVSWGGEMPGGAVLHQLDLARAEVRRSRPTTRDMAEGALSGDGLWLLSGGPFAPSSAHLFEVDEAGCRFELVAVEHGHFAELRAATPADGWFIGELGRTIDLGGTTRRASGEAVAVHPDRDLLASVTFADRDDLGSPVRVVFQALSTGARLAAVVVGTHPFARRTELGAPFGYPRLTFDPARPRLLFAWGPRAVVLDLAALELPAPPRLRVTTPSRVEVSPGETIDLPLSTNLGASAQFRLAGGAAGARVVGDRLRWTPPEEAIGDHDLHLIAESAAHGRASAAVRVRVRRPSIELPFAAAGVALDATSGRALVWGSEDEGPVAVVRLSDGHVDAHSLGASVAVGALAEDAAWLAGGRRLWRLTTDGRAASCLLDVAVTGLEPLPGGRIAARGEGQLLVVEPGVERLTVARRWPISSFDVDGVLRAGLLHVGRRVVDATTLEEVATTGLLDGLMHARQPEPAPPVPLPSVGWNEGVLGEPLGRARLEAAVTDEGGPVRLRLVDPAGGWSPTPLTVTQRLALRGCPTPPWPAFAVAADRAVVVLGPRLYTLELPGGAIAAPFGLAARPERVVVAPRDGPLDVRLTTEGGKGAARFALREAAPGVSIDGDVVRLDPRAVWAAHLRELGDGARDHGGFERPAWATTAGNRDLRQQAVVWFGSAGGTGHPLVVPIVIEARDQAGARAEVWVNVLVAGPFEEVKAIVRRASTTPAVDPEPLRPWRRWNGFFVGVALLAAGLLVGWRLLAARTVSAPAVRPRERPGRSSNRRPEPLPPRPAGLRSFSLALPETLRGPPSPLESLLELTRACPDTGLTPQAFVRQGATSEVMRMGGDPFAIERRIPRFSVMWSSLTTGFTHAAPFDDAQALPACPHHELPSRTLGHIPTSHDAGVDVEGCACGWGAAVWRHRPPHEGPYLVDLLRASVHLASAVRLGMAVRPPEDPAPPYGHVLLRGRLVGHVSLLGDRLFFTNHVGLGLTSTPPLPLDRDDARTVEAELTAALPRLVPELRACMVGSPPGERPPELSSTA